MKSSDDNNGETKRDRKLEAFLKENRPLHPRHSEREAEKIWASIDQEKARSSQHSSGSATQTRSKSAWGPAKSFAIAFSTVAAVAVFSFVSQNPQMPSSPAASTAMSEAEASLVEDSLELTFLEGEEIYEVTDLLSLGK